MKIKYDFAFSFAGEDRAVVEEIKKGLDGFQVFYDEDYKGKLCGMDLYQYLRDLYMNQTKYVVCFLSKSYKQKVWTNLEFSAIKERFMATFFASDFLIPIILEDDVVFEDIPAFIGFHKHKNVNETVSILKTKFEQSLNEDFYLENINHFSEYLLQEIVHDLNYNNIHAECNKNNIILFHDFDKKEFLLLPEDFSKLPCLLLYENKDTTLPIAMITWKRKENIFFSLNVFTNLSQSNFDDISINELVQRIKKYLLNRER